MIWASIIAVSIVAVAGWLIWFSSQAKKAARLDAAKKGVDHAQSAAEIDDNVTRLDESALDRELRRRDD
jgi:hypothetical protein